MGEHRGLMSSGISAEQRTKDIRLNKQFDERYGIDRKAGKVVVVLKREGDREVEPQRFLSLLKGSPTHDQRAREAQGDESERVDARKLNQRGSSSDVDEFFMKRDVEMFVIAKERLKAAGVNVDIPESMAA